MTEIDVVPVGRTYIIWFHAVAFKQFILAIISIACTENINYATG